MSNDYKTPYTLVVDADSLTEEVTPDANYQALSGLAVGSVICGALSILTILSWMLVIFAIAGIVLGWIALRRLHRNPQETKGATMAWTGIGLSVALSLGGYGWNTYQYYFAVPEGYELISYKMLQPEGEERVSGDATMYADRKVFIRGYMYPTKQQSGLKEFLMIDDPGACQFCAPTPKPTQLILVKLLNEMKMTYTTRMIGVGGKFSVHDPKEEGMQGLVYQIEADCLR